MIIESVLDSSTIQLRQLKQEGVERVIDAHIRFLAKMTEYKIHLIYGAGGDTKVTESLKAKFQYSPHKIKRSRQLKSWCFQRGER